ncbi:lysylphosphatidylglycerol synthase domain-containing protein [Cellulomonas chengniuliangii]|uniref:Flippase-like domain-containing protein n=1 Tax=Cellulomonas chengniuliangii TaxID=2968084 RepID=A0ABY5L1Q1_9CELL|nr:lysylphosphatidylglycerol synthase domain-containing protein [Cellulomonas chengniuliangii]MCC2310062.1 flippase-like domain-containing protein [Cellulomonas chengniuliangii]UUI74543.1 flippase-like domain-containing protein [Cellulomonas chengniuliangii]
MSQEPLIEPSSDAVPPGNVGKRRRSLSSGLRVAFAVAILGALTLTLVNRFEDIRHALSNLEWQQVLVSLGCVALGLFAQWHAWHALLAGTGTSTPPRHTSAQIFFVGQLGKYIPGGVWTLLAQAELGSAHAVSRSRSLVVGSGALGVTVVSGAGVGGLALALASPGFLSTYCWALLALPAGAVALTPRVFNWLVALVLRTTRKDVGDLAVSAKPLMLSALWSSAMWLAFGFHAWVLVRALGGRGDHVGLVTLGAVTLSWVIGIVVIFAPAGAGAREVALIALMAPVLDAPEALVLALSSRALLIVGDVAASTAVAPRYIRAKLTAARRRR